MKRLMMIGAVTLALVGSASTFTAGGAQAACAVSGGQNGTLYDPLTGGALVHYGAKAEAREVGTTTQVCVNGIYETHFLSVLNSGRDGHGARTGTDLFGPVGFGFTGIRNQRQIPAGFACGANGCSPATDDIGVYANGACVFRMSSGLFC